MKRDIIKKVKKFVKEEYNKSNPLTKKGLKGHFELVENYAKALLKKENADEEIVILSVWLHDIGTIKGYYKNHHISGAKIAEKFLLKLNYPKNKIEKVKHCILVHRGSKPGKVKLKEAQILINADAMAHFDEINLLLVLYKDKKELLKKLERSYAKLSKRAKPLVKSKLEKARRKLK